MTCRAGSMVILFIALLSALVQVSAQISEVTCPSEFAWMSNSKKQSPCLVAAYLRSACAPKPPTAIETLPPNHHYILRSAIANNCSCNTVVYSLMSACATCQERESLPWSTWKSNCSANFVSQYPMPIPEGTAVPAWAYYNIIPTDSFNSTIAEEIAGENFLDSVALPKPTLSLSSTNSNPPSADDNSSAVKSNNVAPIVSSVLGSSILVAIVAATIFLWRRQRMIMRAMSSQRDSEKAEEDITVSASSEPTIVQEKGIIPPTKLYDPEDPSTFPTSASHDTRVFQPARYAGHAEL